MINEELGMRNAELKVNELDTLADSISFLITNAHAQLKIHVNVAMVQSYWDVGRLIVEEEQKGATRAEYGKQQLELLSKKLTKRLGKGFTVRNLRNMRSFYLTFPIWHAVSTELTWTHYRSLLRVENPSARDWYMKEAISQNWSSRALDRQISVLYYERLRAIEKLGADSE